MLSRQLRKSDAVPASRSLEQEDQESHSSAPETFFVDGVFFVRKILPDRVSVTDTQGCFI